MRINLPEDVLNIIDTFEAYGHEIFLVGGCVRDSLIGKEPKDWDFCTSATPTMMETMYQASHCILPTGLKHGTMTIVLNGNNYEVTSYRIDGEYMDGRHPESVSFTKSLYEDLLRRDFTMNSLAYHPRLGLIDNFNGRKHLQTGLITCVGDPNKRFSEDSLRMLRAVRFSSQLKFNIETETLNAITENHNLLENVSQERIQAELNKMLVCTPTGIGKLIVTGLMYYIIPEFLDMVGNKQDSPYHIYDMSVHTAKAMENIPEDLVLRLTMLLHDIAKPICKSYDDNGVAHYYGHNEKGSDMAGEILRRLKYDNNTIEKVKTLVLYHDATIHPQPKVIRRWLNKIGLDLFKSLLEVKKADILAHAPDSIVFRMEKLRQVETLLEFELEQQNCITRKDLVLNGNDLIDLGFKKGKDLGAVLELLLLKVIEEPKLNNKDSLEPYALLLLDYHNKGTSLKNMLNNIIEGGL